MYQTVFRIEPLPAPVLIQAGQTVRQPVSLEVVSQQLPRGCAEGITPDSVECFSRAIPQPGNYQLLLHGAYHRGQIALLLREGGAEPAPTDYIAFVRGAPAATRTPSPNV